MSGPVARAGTPTSWSGLARHRDVPAAAPEERAAEHSCGRQGQADGEGGASGVAVPGAVPVPAGVPVSPATGCTKKGWEKKCGWVKSFWFWPI